MRKFQTPVILPRLLSAAFLLITSFYCLLAYAPFTYTVFVQSQLIGWVTFFVRWHVHLYWVNALLMAWMLLANRRDRKNRLILGYLFFLALMGFALALYPLLARLQNNFHSLLYSFLPLSILAGLGMIDLSVTWREQVWYRTHPGEEKRIFLAALLAAILVSLGSLGLAQIARATASGQSSMPEMITALAWSLVFLLLFFMSLFTLLLLLQAVSALFSRPPLAHFILIHALLGSLVYLFMYRVILSSISIGGLPARAYSLVFSLSLTFLVAGTSLRVRRSEKDPIASGLAPVCRALGLGFHTPARALVMLAVIIPSHLFITTRLAAMDWDFVVQRLAAAALWVLVFAGCYHLFRARPARRSEWNLFLLAVPLIVLGCYRALDGAGDKLVARLVRAPVDVSVILDRQAACDPSFRLVRGIFTRKQEARSSFYAFLQRNTNRPREIDIPPVPYLLSAGKSVNQAKPHIFIIVIDSLRKDYVAPYNPRVGFTPGIEAFSRESAVFDNAFTHYGSTGLAEPAIWAGGLLLHKQYIVPFYPMNALQRLVQEEGYQSFISMDLVLRTVVQREPGMIELDKGIQNRDYDLCRTLEELRADLDRERDPARPVFAYTQSQNIHVATIAREGATILDGEHYAGFYAPYASRLRRIDRCFGEFIGYLKSRGLYDDSVVILTSDHGDSLGEGGRWGHAYTIFPEIVRVPLIIHLPRQWQQASRDTHAVAFTTDLTPSLYYLLGRRPIVLNGIYGKPLFTDRPEERAPYLQESYLVVSSYGPVYGILRQNGRYLYIADAVNFQEYFYDLMVDPAGSANRIGAAPRAEFEQLIRDNIVAINKFHHLAQDR